MADILEFRVKSTPTAPPRSKRRRKAAEIVIFPGIRYERWEDAPSSDSAKVPERDTLRLVE
ncbi:MAG: hypothetical protein ACKVP7_00900 [Hyphomicrobiaceae bacterium]